MIPHLVQFSSEPITFLSGLQCDLSLFLDQPILLFQPLSQFLHLFDLKLLQYFGKNELKNEKYVRQFGACCSALLWRRDFLLKRLCDAGSLDVVLPAFSFWPPSPAVPGPVYQSPSATLQSAQVDFVARDCKVSRQGSG